VSLAKLTRLSPKGLAAFFPAFINALAAGLDDALDAPPQEVIKEVKIGG
jgi:hypothetical protein